MKKLALVALLPLVSACTVDYGYYAGPIEVQFDHPAERVIVIENLNRAGDCQIIPHNAVFAATYRVAFGPVSRGEALSWAGEYCAPRG
jgi:hypothetical protein